MPPLPAAIKGTRAPTAKNRVATAIPNSPVVLSRAMIDQVILASALSPRRVALHTAGIGGGTPGASDFRGGGEAALRPVGTDLDDMAAVFQRIDGRLRHTGF